MPNPSKCRVSRLETISSIEQDGKMELRSSATSSLELVFIQLVCVDVSENHSVLQHGAVDQ